NCRAVNDDERLLSPRTELVKSARHYVFSSTALARHQHRGVARSDQAKHRTQVLHRRRRTNKTGNTGGWRPFALGPKREISAACSKGCTTFQLSYNLEHNRIGRRSTYRR